MNLDNFKALGYENIFAIGIEDDLITISSQQMRATTLANLLNELEDKNSICIVGAGFSGLTLSAGLVLGEWKDITILEKMPDLLALQNGCDVRYVHPNLINWPDPGYDVEMTSNDLLDWSASTASNVAYNVKKKWLEIISNYIEQHRTGGRAERVISTHTAVSHIHISNNHDGEYRVEWMRDSFVNNFGFKGSSVCDSQVLNVKYLVFSTGFGLEYLAKHSYWRNEDYGQARIDGVQTKYLIRGMGDGGITDLLRLTVKDFRPDRFLEEQKEKKGFNSFLRKIIKIKNQCIANNASLFDEFMVSSSTRDEVGENWRRIFEAFKRDHRSDTIVYITDKTNPNGFKGAFDFSKASFLNKFLLFILFKNGMFQYFSNKTNSNSSIDDGYEDICRKQKISDQNVINRMGSDRKSIINGIFNDFDEAGVPVTLEFKKQPIEECTSFNSHKNINHLLDKLIFLYK